MSLTTVQAEMIPSIATLVAQVAANSPSGSVLLYAGSSAPTGFLLCDGSSVLRATYPGLFSAIGTTYGSVDGTHFNLPNTQGIFVRGAGSQTINAITYSGTLGTKDNDAYASHTHIQNSHGHTDSGHAHSLFQNIGGLAASSASFATFSNLGQGTNTTFNGAANISTTTATNQNSGSGTETKPASISFNYIIKT